MIPLLPVTIIIPTHNRVNLLKGSLDSYLRLPISEILIIDDGSTDYTELFIQSVSDSKLRYFKIGKNVGLPAARNVGIKLAKNEYILMGEDDVLMNEEYVKTLFDNLINLKADFAAGRLVNIKKTEEINYPSESNSSTTKQAYFPKGWIGADFSVKLNEPLKTPWLHACSMYRRELALKYPYYEKLIGNCLREESIFYLNLHKAGKVGYFLSDCCCYHLKPEVTSGGCKKNRVMNFLSSVINEHKFLYKHWDFVKENFQIKYNRVFFELKSIISYLRYQFFK